MVDPDNVTQFARQCAYNGRWYCFDCHDNVNVYPVPSKLLYAADPKPSKVSLRAMWFLQHIKHEPIFIVDMLVRTCCIFFAKISCNPGDFCDVLIMSVPFFESIHWGLLCLGYHRSLQSHDPENHHVAALRAKLEELTEIRQELILLKVS